MLPSVCDIPSSAYGFGSVSERNDLASENPENQVAITQGGAIGALTSQQPKNNKPGR